MGKPIAGEGQFPYSLDGKIINGAKIDGDDYVGELYIFKQRSDTLYDLMDDTPTVYPYISITSRDKDNVKMDVSTADAALTANLKDNTFFIKETDPVTSVDDFVYIYHLHKTILNSGSVIYEQNTVPPTNTTPSTAVTGVTITPSTLSGDIGDTGQLTANVLPSTALNKTVSWGSDDPDVCTVVSSGLVTYVGAGSTTVTATTVDGGFVSSSTVTVTVPNIAVTGVTLDKHSIALTMAETGDKVTATVSPTNATDKSVTYVSSDTSVCTVNVVGDILVVGEGTSTVTVTTTDGGFTDSCTVTITV